MEGLSVDLISLIMIELDCGDLLNMCLTNKHHFSIYKRKTFKIRYIQHNFERTLYYIYIMLEKDSFKKLLEWSTALLSPNMDFIEKIPEAMINRLLLTCVRFHANDNVRIIVDRRAGFQCYISGLKQAVIWDNLEAGTMFIQERGMFAFLQGMHKSCFRIACERSRVDFVKLFLKQKDGVQPTIVCGEMEEALEFMCRYYCPELQTLVFREYKNLSEELGAYSPQRILRAAKHHNNAHMLSLLENNIPPLKKKKIELYENK